MKTHITTFLKSKTVQSILKLGLVFLFLWYLGQKDLISMEATRKAFSRLDLLIPAFAVTLLCTLIGAFRWQILLKAHDINLPIGRTLQLSYIGTFFNVLIPGAVSGDLVKALYIGKEMPGRRADALGSILFDRIVGVSALVMVSALGVGLGYSQLAGSPLLRGVQFIIVASALSVGGFFTYLFVLRETHDPLLIFLQKLSKKFHRAGTFLRIYVGLRHYHHRRGAVVAATLMSMVIHLLIGWTCLQYAHALGEDHLFLLGLYVVVPLGMLVTAVPVAPAGVGTGHFAFLTLFKLIGSDRGGDVFSLVAISSILGGLIGALVYLPFKAKNPDVNSASVSQTA